MLAGRPESLNPKINRFCLDTVSDGEFTDPPLCSRIQQISDELDLGLPESSLHIPNQPDCRAEGLLSI